MQIPKICEFCKQDFIARKTTSVCCSDNCAKRYYKHRKREEKIQNAQQNTTVQKTKASAIITDQLKIINAKQLLTLNEAAVVLNISPLTLRRWLLAKKMQSFKIGKKWMFDSKFIKDFGRL